MTSTTLTRDIDTTVQFHINSTIRDDAFAVFHEIGISPSEAMRVFFVQVQKTKTFPFSVTENTAIIQKDEGYDEWLRARLERTIQKLDSGEMPTYTTEEVRLHLQVRRDGWRTQKNSINAK